MPNDPIPADIRRFILTSIDSVPHLEALLLLRRDPHKGWDAGTLAHTLYLSDKAGTVILAELAAAGCLRVKDEPAGPVYWYQPSTPDLKEKIDRVAEVYATHLIEVTNLIHSKVSKQAQQLGDAFKWQRGKE